MSYKVEVCSLDKNSWRFAPIWQYVGTDEGSGPNQKAAAPNMPPAAQFDAMAPAPVSATRKPIYNSKNAQHIL